MSCTLTNLSLSLSHTSLCDSAVSYSQLRGNRARSAELKKACRVYFCLRLVFAWATVPLWTKLQALICCCPTSLPPLHTLINETVGSRNTYLYRWFSLLRPLLDGSESREIEKKMCMCATVFPNLAMQQVPAEHQEILSASGPQTVRLLTGRDFIS